MSYVNATTTKLLATNCVCCGLPLVDAKSVELGIGPDCRKKAGIPVDISEDVRKEANQLVHDAAIHAQNGAAEKVLEISKQIEELGLDVLAGKVERRFKKGVLKVKVKPDIEITLVNGQMSIKTPYRRGDADNFIQAWRNIEGRKYDRQTKRNIVPVGQREAVWNLLKEFFPNKWGHGPKGAFRVPAPQASPEGEVQVDEGEVQLEFDWQEESRKEQAWEAAYS